MKSINGFLIAAPQSGSGKTTVCLAIMAALVRRGLSVAPFKCGPDFIDPGYHRAVTGRPSINLDGWMCDEDFVLSTFQANLQNHIRPIAIIEGVMGLFDGISNAGKEGSTAQIAAITGVPVVLVVNARGMAASAAALVKGFASFDPQVKFAGVIFNNVGSDNHAALLKEVLAAHCPEIHCFGCIQRDEALALPSRHLGLITVEDNPLSEEFIGRLADMAECSLDMELLAEFIFDSEKASEDNVRSVLKTVSPLRIAVASDAAFCFMYEDNLRLLREAGAELVFFSPLIDSELPTGISGIYLPGGYPELYAERLDHNVSMKESIRTAIAEDMPVYAECGGFVYLTEGSDASEDPSSAKFVSIFPTRCRMLSRRKALGYRQVEFSEDSIVGVKGTVLRGHEFHYSEMVGMPDGVERIYDVSRQGVTHNREGFRYRNCLASYIHLHFGSNPKIAGSFVAACRCYVDRLNILNR